MSWSHVRNSREAWAHVEVSLVDDVDQFKCRECGATRDLEQWEPKASVYRLFARTHFNKHKLEPGVQALIDARTVAAETEVSLFAKTEI